MKIKEIKEFRNKTERDLNKALVEERAKLNDLRFNLALGKVDNVNEIRSTRKNISQLLTLIKEINK
ncbi:MAG: 50S ribosomal protein L29 [Candidatus Paceibacterota bacterium]